jgi:glycosyltransferase involved in cell wall biosynthesis
MKIAFLHYHLKTGGVTTVIRQQVEAIRNDCETLAIAGEIPVEFPIHVATVPGVAYDSENTPSFSPEATASQIIDSITKKWPEGCDVLHVHNPLLAKNENFLKVLEILKAEGTTLFLQIHDFAEDGRPLSYFHEEYPADCHYGVINSRDFKILLKTGLQKNGLHMIPNMITPLGHKPEYCELNNFVLYPVRAIRRKNIGEAILLSLFFKNRETLAVTLPPNSQSDMLSYNGWKKFTKRENLNVKFEASAENDFSSLVSKSKYLITTSITEGFGFSFLEPWTAGKALSGRRLPDITADFERKGIRLDTLYTAISIPVDWIGKKNLYTKIKTTIETNCRLFGYLSEYLDIESIFEKITANNKIDFGLLDENFQKQVISRVLSSGKHSNQIVSMNPFLMNFSASAPIDVIEQNKNKIMENYNEEVYRNNLLQIYKKVLQSRVIQRIDKTKLFFLFLNPERLNLLKWSSYAE